MKVLDRDLSHRSSDPDATGGFAYFSVSRVCILFGEQDRLLRFASWPRWCNEAARKLLSSEVSSNTTEDDASSSFQITVISR